jgi:hypothetical protein
MRLPRILALYAFAIALLLVWQRHRGLAYFDGSEFALNMETGGIAHAPGYPFYLMLGRGLHALGLDGFLAQFVISLAAYLVTAVLMWRTLRDVSKERTSDALAATLATLLFLTHALVLRYVMLPEVFLLNVALHGSLLYALVRWSRTLRLRWLALAGLSYGLGFAHHHTLALTLPGALLVLTIYRPARPTRAAGAFAGGFAIGALPILYLFHSLTPASRQTYYFVQTLDDLLAVLLRKGYGTFSLTAKGEGSGGFGELFRFVTQKIFMGTWGLGAVALAGLVPTIEKFCALPGPRAWAVLRRRPHLAFALPTMLAYLLVFLPRVNLPLTTAAYRGTFERFLIVPVWLLSLVAFEALRVLAPRWRRLSLGLGAVAALAGITSVMREGFRNDHLLEHQIARGYRTIFSASGAPSAPPKCAIFARADSLIFGLHYFNAHHAGPHCYVFTPVSFSGQFRAQEEEALQREVLGKEYAQVLAVYAGRPFPLIQLFFEALKARGFRLFLFYQPDFIAFYNSSFGYRPVGNILELMLSQEPARDLAETRQNFASYLEEAERWGSQLPRQASASAMLDEAVTQSFPQNLNEYPHFVTDDSESSHALRARAEALIKRLP